jgi:hypothetical protein
MGKKIDLTGQHFGRLTVLGISDKRTGRRVMWNCVCLCGNHVAKTTTDLMRKKGNVKSCGCLFREKIYKHGQHGTRLYRIWKGMKDRCFRKNNEYYKNYGGRGITVCREWLDSFEAFHKWAVSHGYADNLSIDRINNDGNYEPGNCRWATPKEQARNRSKNVYITIDGITKTISDWADEKGVKVGLISDRLKRGWNGFDAVMKLVPYE